MRALLIASLLLLASASLAPAGAQAGLVPASASLTLEPFREHAFPGGAPVATSGLLVVYTSAPPAGSGQARLTVTELPGWARVVVDPPVVQLDFAPDGMGWSAQASVSVQATATHAAPAFVPVPIVILAEVEPGIAHSRASAEASVPFTANYRPLLDMTVAATYLTIPPSGERIVALTVTSESNAPTKVHFEVTSNPRHLRVPIPSSITLESAHEGSAATRTVALSVRVPEGVDGLTTFTLVARPAYALDGQLRGEPAQLVFTVDARGHAGQSPGRASGPTEGGLTVLSSPETSAWTLPDGGPAYPLVGAVAGGFVGLALAKRARRS